MALKKYRGHCCGGGQQAIEVVVEAINPVQARQFLEARYPGYTKHYTSSEIRWHTWLPTGSFRFFCSFPLEIYDIYSRFFQR